MSLYFSVVIPLYNKERSICRAVNSVINQVYIYFELLIVNDGSTDSSYERVETIIDHRTRIINKPNGGVSSARNLGISEAKYDYVVFLDADDYWSNNHLDSLVSLIKKYSLGSLYCTNFSILSFNGVKRRNYLNDAVKEGYIRDYFKLCMKYVILHPSTVCIKKEAMVNLGGFDNHLTHGEDLDLWFRAMSKLSGVFIDTETVTVDISAENRAMHKQLTYKTHILNIVERHRDNSIQYKNEYLDLYILKNCIPFYFGKDKMTIISKFEDILRGPKVSFYWKIVYSEKLYLLNRTMYFSYKAIKYKWRITRNIFFQKSTKY